MCVRRFLLRTATVPLLVNDLEIPKALCDGPDNHGHGRQPLNELQTASTIAASEANSRANLLLYCCLPCSAVAMLEPDMQCLPTTRCLEDVSVFLSSAHQST